MTTQILEVNNLQVDYLARNRTVKAVDRVSFTLGKGETLGLVGESGCGKSTLGFSILRLVPPPGKIVSGEIVFDGEDLLQKTEADMRKIRGKRLSMIFQDPMTSLNPLMRIGDHIVETIRVHEDVSKEDAWKRAEKLLDKLGIPRDRLKDYPHQFSGGMRQRIMIGLGLVLNPSLMVADEPTTSLDVIVEAQILELLKELKRDYNLTLILITHNMGVVAELSEKIAVMYAGEIIELADTDSLYERPFHPYTMKLLRSIPNIRLTEQHVESIPGSPPDLANPPTGCRFNPRCPYAIKRCRDQELLLTKVDKNRYVACIRYGDLFDA